MSTYRIFTNDRGTIKGTPMYSALKEVKASNAMEAIKKCPPNFTYPKVANAVALKWPPNDEGKQWLKKFV